VLIYGVSGFCEFLVHKSFKQFSSFKFYRLIANLRFKTKERGKKEITTMKMSSDPGNFNFLNRAQLIKIRQKAIRAGVWYKALRRIDRVLVDLTIQVADNIRSSSLAKSILEVTRKLENIMESKFSRAIKEIGVPLAQKLSQYALNWGNKTAQMWVNDIGYARYLSVMQLNGAFR
jgi:hypothetical protein